LGDAARTWGYEDRRCLETFVDQGFERHGHTAFGSVLTSGVGLAAPLDHPKPVNGRKCKHSHGYKPGTCKVITEDTFYDVTVPGHPKTQLQISIVVGHEEFVELVVTEVQCPLGAPRRIVLFPRAPVRLQDR
jgi:hypothetical protein